jgi:hypothetical protein
MPALITETNIDAIEKLFGLSFDDERRAILRCTETKDIRACPGSGKTTLLVAKLALLTNQWKQGHCGICVLSHTNVARREIQKRFSKAPSLQALNTYPHFVGTMQSFVNTFLGIPGAIAKFGARPSVFDDERYTFEARRELFRGLATKYKGAAYALGKSQGATSAAEYAEVFAQIEYRNGDLALGWEGKPLPIKESAATYPAIRQFKEALSKRGYFRYRDMDALGTWYLHEFPEIAGFLQLRFPYVFIDEAQDSIPEESDLITSIFHAGSVIQRFGDDRQAIYRDPTTQGETAESRFPSEQVLPMRRSHRLSQSIAGLVKHVCSGELEEMEGNPESPQTPKCRHTVLLFSKDRIDTVLPCYAKIVAEEVGVGLASSDVRAVGATAARRAEGKKFPSAIGDYWPPFVLPTRLGNGRILSFHDCVTRAGSSLSTSHATADARDYLLEGMARVLTLQGILFEGLPYKGGTVVRALREASAGRTRALDSFLGELCIELLQHANEIDEGVWKKKFLNLLSVLHVGAWNEGATAFMESAEVAPVAAPNAAPKSVDGVFRGTAATGEVSIQVGTIHSVKGETVKAMLVLETFIYTHDLKDLVNAGYLRGSQPKKCGVRLANHVKRVFVAMSRPTHLLCLAMARDHVDDEAQKALEDLGWRIVAV